MQDLNLFLFSLPAPGDADESARSKVDRLGAVLKAGVSRLRAAEQADLFFLVDSSASVGADNFFDEIKFIRRVRIVILFSFI